jgi:hypothetical protein
MPRITLVGFFGDALEKADSLSEALDTFAKEGPEREESIKAVLQGAAYYDEVVLAETISCVEDLSGRQRPYLSISATDALHLEDLLRRLDELNFDIEVEPILSRFVPRRSDRQKDQGSLPLEPSPTVPEVSAMDFGGKGRDQHFDEPSRTRLRPRSLGG